MAISDNQSTLAKRPVKDVYAVSRLVREARGVLEGGFPLIWVEGELSNLAMPASGHIYFTLKDEAAQVHCAMFKGRNRQLRFIPENGMQVLMRVRVTLYEGRGEFQLVVEHMEEAGSGALQRAYEALKQRLGQEGLFDEAHKQSLPTIPQRIGVVSSPDGAAVHDILTVLNRRFPDVEVVLYPVAVQGNDSAQQIADAIALAEQRSECDVLIVGRGGGSLEDLWSFNEERVARAIFACSLPIISAVGHEIDFTIADFVADVRAATPSAAAELAVADASELIQRFRHYQQRLSQLLSHDLQIKQRHLKQLTQRLPKSQSTILQQYQRLQLANKQLQQAWQYSLIQRQQRLDYWSVRLRHPQSKIDNQRYKLATLTQRLSDGAMQRFSEASRRQSDVQQRLSLCSPLPRLERHQDKSQQLMMRLHQQMSRLLEQKQSHCQQQMRTLTAVSPLQTLERGYSITTQKQNKKVIYDASDVAVDDEISVTLQKGSLNCQIREIKA